MTRDEEIREWLRGPEAFGIALRASAKPAPAGGLDTVLDDLADALPSSPSERARKLEYAIERARAHIAFGRHGEAEDVLAAAVGPPAECRCISYHERTGTHADGCPLAPAESASSSPPAGGETVESEEGTYGGFVRVGNQLRGTRRIAVSGHAAAETFSLDVVEEGAGRGLYTNLTRAEFVEHVRLCQKALGVPAGGEGDDEHDHWHLCCECGSITGAETWARFVLDLETGEWAPAPDDSSDPMERCPVCQHDHYDGGNGNGFFEGTRAEVEAERTRMLAEAADPHATDWRSEWAQKLVEVAALAREHAVARQLCFEKHGDWRYDPGCPSHEEWLARARRVLEAAGRSPVSSVGEERDAPEEDRPHG